MPVNSENYTNNYSSKPNKQVTVIHPLSDEPQITDQTVTRPQFKLSSEELNLILGHDDPLDTQQEETMAEHAQPPQTAYHQPSSHPVVMPHPVQNSSHAQHPASQRAIEGEYMSHSTGNTPVPAQKQPRPKGMTRAQLIQEMVGYFAHNYVLIQDLNGACFLQGRLDSTLHPISSDAFYVPMKTYAMHRYGKELTDGMIKSAMDLFCGQTYPKASGTIPCGRSFSLLGHVLYYSGPSGSMIELRYDPASGPYRPPSIPQPPPLMINRSASLSYGYTFPVTYSVLENLFRGYSVSEGEYLVLITWMVSALITPSGAFLLELIDDDNQRVQKIQRDLKQLIDACVQDFIPEVPTQRKQFDTLALDHYLLNFSPVEKLTVPMQKNLLSLLSGCTVNVDLKPKRDSYSVCVQRPVLLSADESVITHGPLLDRAITLYLSRTTSPENVDMSIPPNEYFSAWLNLASCVNYWMAQRYNKNATPLETFHQIGTLVCQALAKNEKLFIQAMDRQASIRQELKLSENPVAQVLIAYLDDKAIASESKSTIDWLGALNAFSPKRARETDWPATPRALGAAFKQAKPVLAAVGIECGGETRGSFRVWTVQRKHDITDDSNE